MKIADSLEFDDQSPRSAAEWIENQILAGRLAPGARVDLRVLAAHHRIGASDWSEVFARLSLAGLAIPDGDQALRVAPVSLADLEDLTSTRILIEGAALRAAIGAGDDAWEAGIRAAYMPLAGLDPQLTSGVLPPGWEEANRAFHHALTAACPARRLLHFAAQLYLQHERYRRLSSARSVNLRSVADEHRALCEATLARDASQAVALLAEHIQRTATIAADGIRDGSWFGYSGDHSRPLR